MSADFERNYDLSKRPAPPGLAVRIISGQDDWIRGYEPQLLAHYPQAKVRLVADASHFPWVESPCDTWRALEAALAISRPPRGSPRSAST